MANKHFSVYLKNKKKNLSPCLDIILFTAFFIFICVITTTKIIDDDVFWHLASGKYITENKTVPSADVFGHSTSGTEWIPFEWGWDVLTFLLWMHGDYFLLSFFKSIIIIMLLIFYYLMLRKFNVPGFLFMIAALILCFGLIGRFVLRPHLISYLFSAAIICGLFYYKYFSSRTGKWIYLIPLIFLTWANMHMGVSLGIGIMFLFIIAEFINTKISFFKVGEKLLSYCELRKLSMIFLISLVIILLNPNFLHTYIYTFKLLQMQSLGFINEWASPLDERFLSTYYVKIYFFFLFCGAFIIYYSLKTKDIFPAMLYLVFGIFSVFAFRFIADFIVIIFIPAVISLNYIVKQTKKEGVLYTVFHGNSVKLLLTGVIIFLIFNTFNNKIYDAFNNRFREMGFGTSGKLYPVELFSFIKDEKINEIGSKPFNNMKIGGFFIWNFPESKNFIDSRFLNDSIVSDYLDIYLCRGDFENKLISFDIDYVIISAPDFATQPLEIQFNIIGYLIKNQNWKLIYWDDKSFLFVKNEQKFEHVISKYEYKYLTPLNCVFRKQLLADIMKNNSRVLLNEIKRNLERNKNGLFVNDLLTYLNLKTMISSLE